MGIDLDIYMPFAYKALLWLIYYTISIPFICLFFKLKNDLLFRIWDIFAKSVILIFFFPIFCVYYEFGQEVRHNLGCGWLTGFVFTISLLMIGWGASQFVFSSAFHIFGKKW